MNKCLRQNWKIFSKFKFRPQGTLEEEYPRTPDEANEKSREIWNHLVDDELQRHAYYSVKGKKGYTITVWSDDKYVYLVQCVRTEWNTDEITVFIDDKSENSIRDYCSVAKMLRYNIKDIIGHSQEGVKVLNQLKAVEEIKEKAVKA